MSIFHDSEICRSILESLPSGLCVVDAHKKIVFWSDGAERITGHLRHEVTGRSCSAERLLHCDDPGCEFCGGACPVASAMKTSHSVETAGFLHHKNGYEIPVRIRAVPVHNQHGSIIGAAETFEELLHASQPYQSENGQAASGSIDEITNIAGHALMQFHLRRAFATFVQHQVPFAVLCLRLEGLQHFRASLGTEAASSLLRVVARSLESTLSTTDAVGRWSDDQFLAVINGCTEQALPPMRERIRRALAGDGIEWWGERRSLPVSIGEASVRPGETLDSVIERAVKSLETAATPRSRAAAVVPADSSGRTSGG